VPCSKPFAAITRRSGKHSAHVEGRWLAVRNWRLASKKKHCSMDSGGQPSRFFDLTCLA
jgi:hypothetical protein